MGVIQDMKDIVEMFQDGGILVITFLDAKTKVFRMTTDDYQENIKAIANIQDQAHHPAIEGIRTSIQLDGDIVTILTPQMIQQNNLWQQHLNVIESKMLLFARLQNWIRTGSGLFFFLIWLGFIGATTQPNEFFNRWFVVVTNTIVGFILYQVWRIIAPRFFRWMVPHLLRMANWIIQRQQ